LFGMGKRTSVSEESKRRKWRGMNMVKLYYTHVWQYLSETTFHN
jgi:hypothetical protein